MSNVFIGKHYVGFSPTASRGANSGGAAVP
jgi:hypothetical protein